MLCDHNRGQGHVRSPGKKGQAKKIRDLELRYMFLGKIFTKNAKNDPKHFLKHQNRSKNKILKSTGKSQNDVKSACFWHVLCHISAIFEDIDLTFCTHIYQPLPSNILYGFWKFWFWGGKFWIEKKLLKILEILENFQKFQNPRWQFCSPTNSTSFHIRKFIVALKLHSWRRFP